MHKPSVLQGRWGRWILMFALLLPLVLQAVPAAAAGNYTVVGTGGSGVNLRATPSTSGTVIKTLPEGSSHFIECQVEGDYVTAPNGVRSHIWNRTEGGYATDLYWNTPNVDAFSMDRCGGTPAPTTDNATYVSEGPPTDGTSVVAGTSFSKRWTVRNSGTSTWSTSGYRATRISGTYGPVTINLPGNVGPGAQVDVTGSFTAPSTTGRQKATYQMQGPGGVFGQTFWVDINVTSGGGGLPAGRACLFEAPDGVSAGGLIGHTGWAFRNGTSNNWIFGATEGTGASEIPAGQNNNSWKSSGTWEQVKSAFRSGEHFNKGFGYYTKYRCADVGASYPSNASVQGDVNASSGYSWAVNNCLTKSVQVLRAYGVPNLPDATFTSPNFYYNNRLPSSFSASTNL